MTTASSVFGWNVNTELRSSKNLYPFIVTVCRWVINGSRWNFTFSVSSDACWSICFKISKKEPQNPESALPLAITVLGLCCNYWQRIIKPRNSKLNMKSIVSWGIDNKIIPNFKKKLKIWKCVLAFKSVSLIRSAFNLSFLNK